MTSRSLVYAQPKIIDRVQQKLLVTSNGRSDNVLTMGYRSVSRFFDWNLQLFRLLQAEQRAETGKPGRSNVFNFFVNTTVDILRSCDWCVLLQRYESCVAEKRSGSNPPFQHRRRRYARSPQEYQHLSSATQWVPLPSHGQAPV